MRSGSKGNPRDTGDEATILSGRATRTPLMTPEEEHRCIGAWQRDRDETARTSLVDANLLFLFKMARGFDGFHVPVADLVAAGAVGLTVAIDRFDLTRPVRFTTYAAYWMRTEMMALILTATGTGHTMGSKPGKLFFKLRRAKHLIEAAADRDVEIARVAAQHRLDPRELEALLVETTVVAGSLDVPVAPEMTTSRRDAIPGVAVPADDQLDDRRRHDSWTRGIGAALDRLTPKQRYVIEHRHLCDQDDRQNLEEIGKKFGVTREAVRLWEQRAFKRLRAALRRFWSDVSVARATLVADAAE